MATPLRRYKNERRGCKMKLYSQSKTERATKTQGGNEFLEVEITADRRSLVEIKVHEQKDNWHIDIWDRENNRHRLFAIPTEEAIQKNMKRQ